VTGLTLGRDQRPVAAWGELARIGTDGGISAAERCTLKDRHALERQRLARR